MAHTRVIYELDDDGDTSTAILQALYASFKQYCGHLECEIVPQYSYEVHRDLHEGVLASAKNAEADILSNPECTLCIYIAPRMLLIGDDAITSTVIVLRDRTHVFATRLQVIHEESIPRRLQKTIRELIERARNELLAGHVPSAPEEKLATTAIFALQNAFSLAHSMIFTQQNMRKQ